MFNKINFELQLKIRRRFLCIAIFFSIYCILLVSLDAAPKTIRIPFRYVQSFIIVELKLDQIIPVKLIFDTGAEHTILFEKKWTDYFDNPYQREIKVLGSDLQQELPALLTSPMKLYFEDYFSVSIPLIVLKKNSTNISQVIGESVQGILSASVFKQFIVEVDYRNRYIILHQPTFVPNNSFTKVDIQIFKNKPYLQAMVRTKDASQQLLNLLLDTGASLSFLLYNDSTRSKSVPDKIIPGYLGSGLGGVLSGFVGKINSIRIDSFLLEDIITHYLNVESNFAINERMNKDGIIGNQILDKFNLMIDYNREILFLKPQKHFRKPLDYDKSGMLLVAGGRDLQSYYVAHVIPGTPAAVAGILENDQILKINNIPVAFISFSKINSMLHKKEGKIIKLTVRRGLDKLKFCFNLKTLI